MGILTILPKKTPKVNINVINIFQKILYFNIKNRLLPEKY